MSYGNDITCLQLTAALLSSLKMELPLKTSCKRIETKSGQHLYLLIKWWKQDVFDIEATDIISAWKATQCQRPPLQTGRDASTEKAQEAFGFVPARTFFEFDVIEREDVCELMWSWPSLHEDLRAVDKLILQATDVGAALHAFLSNATELSSLMMDMEIENRQTQETIERDMLTLKKAIKEATDSRRSIYTRCAALINEKNREIEEKEREIEELRARMTDNEPCDIDMST